MNDIVDEINDRLDDSFTDVDYEIKKPNIIQKDFEYYQSKKLEAAEELVNEQTDNNLKPVVDLYTGEVRRFRSCNAPGQYCKAEICTQESETDSKMYESLETTIERCSRAPALRALIANEQLFNDGSPDPDMDADFDETMAPGYDIVDAAQTMEQIAESVERVRTTTSKPASEAKDEQAPSEGKAE